MVLDYLVREDSAKPDILRRLFALHHIAKDFIPGM
jgi:hypothetical protein